MARGGWRVECKGEKRASARGGGEFPADDAAHGAPPARRCPGRGDDHSAGRLCIPAAGSVQLYPGGPRLVASRPGNRRGELDGAHRCLAGRRALFPVWRQCAVVARHAWLCQLVDDPHTPGQHRLGRHGGCRAPGRLGPLAAGHHHPGGTALLFAAERAALLVGRHSGRRAGRCPGAPGRFRRHRAAGTSCHAVWLPAVHRCFLVHGDGRAGPSHAQALALGGHALRTGARAL